MTAATHWRLALAKDVDALTLDAEHVPGGIRWRLDRSRALVRFRGEPATKKHLTPDQARALCAQSQWTRVSAE